METIRTTEGLMIRRAEYGDYDRMLTLFTPEYGRVDAIARGCRRPKSPLCNAVELFTVGVYTLRRTAVGYAVTQCSIKESFYPLRCHWERLLHGAYWLKLLLRTVQPELPYPALYAMIRTALAYLAYDDAQPLALLTAMMEMQFMRFMGLSPNMETCVRCGCTPTAEALRFDPRLGGLACARCAPKGRPLNEGARRILRKAPYTQFSAVEKLTSHPDWLLAASCIRSFVRERLALDDDILRGLDEPETR